jgi:hypothetical protein
MKTVMTTEPNPTHTAIQVLCWGGGDPRYLTKLLASKAC